MRSASAIWNCVGISLYFIIYLEATVTTTPTEDSPAAADEANGAENWTSVINTHISRKCKSVSLNEKLTPEMRTWYHVHADCLALIADGKLLNVRDQCKTLPEDYNLHDYIVLSSLAKYIQNYPAQCCKYLQNEKILDATYNVVLDWRHIILHNNIKTAFVEGCKVLAPHQKMQITLCDPTKNAPPK